MAGIDYMIIVAVFILYYLIVLIFEKKILDGPTEIIEKFLAITLGYAGVSLIYYSITGQPFLTTDPSQYNVYIFIIGFISLLWAIPNLLSEFQFFQRFKEAGEKRKKKLKRKK